MKRTILLEVLSALFATLFVYTGTNKILEHRSFVFDLGRDPMIGTSLASFASLAVPAVEILVATLLLIPKTQKIGIVSTVVLMTCFTIYVRLMLHSPVRHCTCGGVLRQMTWTQHLYFNVCFTILSLVALLLCYSKEEKPYHLSGNPESHSTN